MARPIEPTPILYGEDAERFLEDLNNLKYSEKKERFLKECDEVYKKVTKKL